jgi:hypothetical protein
LDDQKRYTTYEHLGEKGALAALESGVPQTMEQGVVFLCYHGTNPKEVFGRLLQHVENRDARVRKFILHGLFLVSRLREYISYKDALSAAYRNLEDEDPEVRESADTLMDEALSRLCKGNMSVESLQLETEMGRPIKSIFDFRLQCEALRGDNLHQARELCLKGIASEHAMVRAYALRTSRSIFVDDDNVDLAFVSLLQKKTEIDPSKLVQDVRLSNQTLLDDAV